VAVLTIPHLISSYNERTAVTKVKKTYSILANAVNLWQKENGCETNAADCWSSLSLHDSKNAFSGIEAHLNIAARRYQNESLNNIDWLPDISYGLNGNKANYSWQGVSKSSNSANQTCHYLFKDGTTMMVHFDNHYHDMVIFIDVNGKAKPNRVGKDIFPIGIGSNGSKSKTINPYYVEDDMMTPYGLGLCNYRNGNECSPNDGKSPTAYVLTHDKLPKL